MNNPESGQQTPNGFFYLCIPDGALKLVQTIARFHNVSMVDAINMAVGSEYKRILEKEAKDM